MHFALDGNNDIVIGRGAGRVDDSQYTLQLVKNRLLTLLGEWEFDRSIGLPWFTTLLGANYDINVIETQVRNTILQTSGVASLVSLNIDVERTARQATIRFEATTIYNTIISDVVFGVGGRS